MNIRVPKNQFARTGFIAGGVTAYIMLFSTVCFARGVVVSSWEPGSETPGLEYIYNQSSGMSVQQSVTYRDKWYPYPLDGSQPEPFGNPDVLGYSITSGITDGTRALTIGRASGYFSMQATGQVPVANLLASKAVTLDVTYDKSLWLNPLTPGQGWSNFDLIINSPEGFVTVPRTIASGASDIITTPGQTLAQGRANSSPTDWNYGAAETAPIETHHVRWNLFDPNFKANSGPYSGMQYMAAMNADNTDGTPIGYAQFNMAPNGNYSNFFNPDNANAPVTFILDNFKFILPDLRGDLNQDGKFTNVDIQAALAAVVDPTAYMAINDVQPSDLNVMGDFNSDGVFDETDIGGLLKALANPTGGGSITAVPEPSALLLLMLGLPVVVIARRKSAADRVGFVTK
jgi:hypothetical protein